VVPLAVGLPATYIYSLFRHLINRHGEDNRLIMTVLAFALVFASLHFVQHDLEASSGDLNVHDECQLCRLNHVPLVSTPEHSLFLPLRVIAFVLPTQIIKHNNTLRFPTLGARAPPLS